MFDAIKSSDICVRGRCGPKYYTRSLIPYPDDYRPLLYDFLLSGVTRFGLIVEASARLSHETTNSQV